MQGHVNKHFVFKSLLTTPSNFLPLHLKQTFLPLIWIFTEVEGDVIESRQPFKIFFTLSPNPMRKNHKKTIKDIIRGYFQFANLWTGISSISLEFLNAPRSTGVNPRKWIKPLTSSLAFWSSPAKKTSFVPRENNSHNDFFYTPS